MKFLRNVWNDEQGQDLTEYTLLMAVVAVVVLAFYVGAGGSIKGIWGKVSSTLGPASPTVGKHMGH